MCKVGDIPLCLQMYIDGILVYWDMMPPYHQYSQIVYDLGPNGFNLDALTLNFVNQDPIYVDGQGLYFDQPGKLVERRTDWDFERNSITVEIWVRFNLTENGGNFPGDNRVFTKFRGGTDYFYMTFDANPYYVVSTNLVDFPLDGAGAPTLFDYTWYFIASTIIKISPNQSR